MNKSLTNRQNQILKTTIDIIHIDGIQGFTIKELSKKMGFTEAAIYRHFKSKNEILCAVLDAFIGKLTRFTDDILKTNLSSLQKIKRIYNNLSRLFTENPAYVSIIFAEEIFKNDKLLSDKVMTILFINNNVFNLIVKEGQEKNEIINSVGNEEIALMVMGAFRLMVKQWLIYNFSFDLINRSNHLFIGFNKILNDNILITNKII